MKNTLNASHRRPVGGYGVPSERIRTTITLPSWLSKEVKKNHPEFSKYIRGLIMNDFIINRSKQNLDRIA